MPKRAPKIIAILLCFLFLLEQSGFAQVAGSTALTTSAQLNIAAHLSVLHSSFVPDKFRPLHLRYLQYNPQENTFRLLLDKGDTRELSDSLLEDTSKTILKYFLIGLSLPNDSFWVNLMPDSPDSIIDPYLEQTDIGRIMLETDLQLKKDTAKATSPETPEGREYWDKLYKKAGELFSTGGGPAYGGGNENVTIPTLTRPWIVPDEIIVRETTDSAYIYKATLKVMLEQDYLKDSATYNFTDSRLKELNEYSSELIRELIILKLTKEVNSAKRYAALRQIYYSLIMAQWFKARQGLSPPPPSQAGTVPNACAQFIDSRNLANLASQEPFSKDTYFKEYQKSFKDGEYNIKEPAYTAFGQIIRSYFSGGISDLSGGAGFRQALEAEGHSSDNKKIVTAGPDVPSAGAKVVIGLKAMPTENPREFRIIREQPGGSVTSAIITAQDEVDLERKIIGIEEAHNKQTIPEKARALKNVDLNLGERRAIIEYYVAGIKEQPEEQLLKGSPEEESQARIFLAERINIVQLDRQFNEIINSHGYLPFQKLYVASGANAWGLFQYGLPAVKNPKCFLTAILDALENITLSIRKAEKVFERLDLSGLALGSQAYVKLLLLDAARNHELTPAFQTRLEQEVIPGLRRIETISRRYPTLGTELQLSYEAESGLKEAVEEIFICNWLSDVKLEHSMNRSSITARQRYELRILPTVYPIFLLLVDKLYKTGIFKISFPTYMTTISGDYLKEAPFLLQVLFFNTLRQPKVLSEALKLYESEQTPEAYLALWPGVGGNFVGATVNPWTGKKLTADDPQSKGTQTNFFHSESVA